MADQPIIIKRVKKGGHAAHGGAWKVAYADFVTAMMAFFLLLWLLNSVTEEQLVGISNYFAPTAVSQTPSGAGGVLGGQVLGEGAMQSKSSSPSVQLTLPPPTIGTGGNEFTDANEGQEKTQTDADTPRRGQPDADPGEGPGGSTQGEGGQGAQGQQGAAGSAADAAAEQRQNAEFQKAAAEIRQSLQAVPALKALANNLIIDNTPEGLRIQLVDQDGLSMFPSGSSRLLPHTRDLMALVTKAIEDVPNKVSIAGHTDATPYADPSGYSNWELSADRALASRRALLASGLGEGRIDRVEGKAATDPLMPEDPADPRNRRITITLLRDRSLYENKGAGDGSGAGGGPGGGAPAARPPSIFSVPNSNQL
ncbi:flagellar motor protein MotB [Pararhodospirillum oryzae]|uniref:Membrane protein n=1 Tax=Pararhodospirillum oryzae TaxID=478448 RepID=A0A512H4T2_9PROT|nr:flagellar motor protein MotB [Pararhodospirillum oryzae]GEO80466.1 membrane protein [Pararhodospirillum oryzae]